MKWRIDRSMVVEATQRRDFLGCSAPIRVVLLSQVIKYLTDEELSQALWEAKRVLKPSGRIVLWEFHPVWTPAVTSLILRCCKAQKLRGAAELQDALKAAGFSDLRPFRVITPWLPWSNVAFTGCLDELPWKK